jgi:hypothetical protein
MAADIEQAEFEHCEESGGTGADEDNVGIYIVNHQELLENSCCAWAAMPGGLAVLPIRLQARPGAIIAEEVPGIPSGN